MALRDVSCLVLSQRDMTVWIRLDVNDPEEARSWMMRYLYSAMAPVVYTENYDFDNPEECEDAEFYVRCYYFATEPHFRAMAQSGNYKGSQKLFVHTMNNMCVLASLAEGDRVVDIKMENRRT